MTSKFDGFEHDSASENQINQNPTDLTPDRFELLSAYIDGELSPSEKNMVQTWLDRDSDFKQLYIQLMALQGRIQNSVAPPSEKSLDQITAGVFDSIDCHRRRRRQLIWGGSAIATALLAGISAIVPGKTPFSAQMAKIETNPTSHLVMLAVAIDQPAINIPKSVTDYSETNSGFSD